MFTDAQMTSASGRRQDFQRGGVEFVLKRAKQGASEVSVAYVRLCVFLELDSLVGSGVKSREKIYFLGFESPRLREN